MASTTPTSMTKLSIAYLDFDTIKASLRDYLRSQTIFKDYSFEGSGLAILLDVLSYNTHYFGFYLNMIADEMFLDSAALRSSVVSLAKMLNYTPRSVTSAQATVSVTITPNDNTASAVIEKNTAFVAVVNGTNFNFVTNQAYSATIANGTYSFPIVQLIEGIPYTYSWTVDNSIPNQRFVLPNPSIDTSTLTVQVQNSITDTTVQYFSLANDLMQIKATTPVYFLQEVENQQFEIYFGDGVIGLPVVDGNVILVSYILSDGDAANGATVFTPASTIAGYQKYLTTTTTLQNSAGGEAPESIDSIKFSAPKNYEAQGRAVTASDYTLIMQDNYPNLASVAVWGGETMSPPQYGKVYISIKPVDGYVVTQTTKALVISNILRPYNIVSVIPEIVDPIYIFIIVNCVVKYNPSITANTPGDIAGEAYNAILAYAQTNLDQFELELRYSRLLAAIDGADQSITNNLTTIQMKSVFQPALNIVANYQFAMNNPITPGTLTSTSFVTVNDPQLTTAYVNGNTYTLADDSNGNVTMIQHGIGVPNVVVRTSCGTINYTTGAITLQGIIPNQADVNGNISLIMSPAQNDIIPLQNNILFVQPSDINVTVLANPQITA
jgi:hypothetical protein